MANGKKKIKKIAKMVGKAAYGATPMGSLESVAKTVQKSARGYGKLIGRVACQKKGGKWVGGKCIPKGSEVRTGRKKYSESPERSS